MKKQSVFGIWTILMMTLLLACSKQMNEVVMDPALENSSTALSAAGTQASEAAGIIKDQYIVVFKDQVGDVEQEVARMRQALGIQTRFVYKHTIKGFSATLPAPALEALRKNELVNYIDQDQVVSINATQNSATWGIDRVDQTSLPLSGTYTYTTNGSTADAYVFDTGIWLTHNEFGGRAVAGYDAFGGNTVDQNGHGTHVAGTIGGTTYGIAKGIRLIAVRVLDASGSGTWSGVIAGLDWAAADHTTKPAVGNMSLGGGAITSVDDAVRRCVADGIVMSVAAGNSSANASNYSPARVAEAITVGSTTSADALSGFSNYGSIVDILAPGSGITSAWYGSNSATTTISGTSMATPHVAGVSALYLEANPGASPADVSTGLKAIATPNKITSVPTGTPNLLLYAQFGPPPPPPGTPSLVSPADGAINVPVSTTFNWGAITDATSYTLQVSTASDFSTLRVNTSGIASTSFNVTGLSSNTVYYWRVRAANGGGSSDWSVVRSFTTAEPVILPAPSLNLPANGAVALGTKVSFSWFAVTGASSYQLQISSNSGFATTVVNRTGLTGTSVIISSLKRGVTYYWRVRAVDASGTPSTWSVVRSFTS